MSYESSQFTRAWEAFRSGPPPKQSLGEIIRLLFDSEPVHVLTDDTDWDRQIECLKSGELVEVTEEIYWYWLEVLPPKIQHGSFFAFAEGQEALLLFLQQRRRYLARQKERFRNSPTV